MSEEEKKAIEYLKFYINDNENEYFDKDFVINKKELQTLLNLIEKQQKEIEELKEKNKRLEQDRNEYKEEYINLQNARYYNYISKDKIREKIKELENGVYDAKIILENLLKEGE